MGGSDAPMPYKPAYQGQADQQYYSGLMGQGQNLNNLYQYAQQQFGNLYGNTQNNPYNAQALAGAQQTAQLGQGQGLGEIAAGNQALQQGQAAYNQAMGYVPGVLQTGFDPQSSLYNYNLQQTTDAAKAAAAQSGLAGSPFAAGAAGDAAQKFNLDWANNQQARQGQAISQLGNLYGSANNAYQTGADLYSQLGSKGLDTLAGTSGAPANVYGQQQQQSLGALQALVDALGGITGLQQRDTGLWGQYLGLGQSATQIADQATQYNNQSSLLGGLGSILGSAAQIAPYALGL